MEKIFKHHGERLPPVRLYLDDIKKIIGILSEVSENIDLEADEYKYESLTELTTQNLYQINSLTISSSDPYVSLHFAPDSVWLFITKDTAELRGIFEKIKKFLRSKRRKLYFMHKNPFLTSAIIGTFSGLSLPLFPIFIRNLITTGATARIILILSLATIWLIFIIIVFSWFFYLQYKRYSTIILMPRTEQTNFWQRNSDKLIVGLIVSIFSVLVTAFVTYFITRSVK